MAATNKRQTLMSFTALKAMCDSLPRMTLEEFRLQSINNTIGIASDEQMMASPEEKEHRHKQIAALYPKGDPFLALEYKTYCQVMDELEGKAKG
jgi:hypothetical protein